MNDISDFYDNLDLKYPEMAICIDRIDRFNPGVCKFIIPVLTPTMSKTSVQENTVFQNSSNIMNGGVVPEISNITMSNYLEIDLPRELCGGMDETFLNLVSYVADASVSCTSGGGDNHWCRGTINKVIKKLIDFIKPEIRYIEPYSKWIVVFIGGDITNPRIIAPYETLPRATK